MMPSPLGSFFVAVVLAMASLSSPSHSQEDPFASFSWRAIGPAATGGRIVDFAMHPDHPHRLVVASASGGVWKSENDGTTWEPIFDRAGSISIGAIAVAPSNPEILWVGTGEANNQRSSYWGDGVYRSDDGGRTWRNTGLRDSHHIGRIVVHPENPDVVHVAAAGHLYSFNRQRGVFRTTNGGRTWEHVLYISDEVGVIDLAMHPREPETLFAASYERLRRAWHFDGAGPGSAIYKTIDGGESWKRLEGGLPQGEIGRIGVAIHAGDPRIVYATVENANPRPEGAGEGGRVILEEGEEPVVPGLELANAEPIGGEVYRSEDGGDTWTRTNDEPVGGLPGYYYGQIRIDPGDSRRVYVLGVPLFVSEDGGKTFRSDGARGVHVDHHALWIDPADSRHQLLGNDGGVHITYDRGRTWDYVDNLPLAQLYAIGVDDRTPYHVYGGTQDNGTWTGPSDNHLQFGVSSSDWVAVNGGDGFYALVDPSDPDVVYSEIQFGGLSRVDLASGERKSIRPRPPEGENYRFNWNSPIHLSPHNPWIVYFGGNKLFRSLDRGDRWQTISPDLSTADEEKVAGNVPHCTITTIAESPRVPELIWVGTDDGRIQVTRDGGKTWKDTAPRLPGVPPHRWVTRVSPSYHRDGTCYVTMSGYRDDDFAPYVFVTRDFGESWDSLAANLPQGPLNVIVEDRENSDLLFLGAEFAAYGSIDGGERWSVLERGLPRVAVYDLVIHPREGDVVAGTHGRGFFVMDVSPLRAMTRAAREERAVLAQPRKTYVRRRISAMQDGFMGHRIYRVENPGPLMKVGVYLRDDPGEGEVKLTLSNDEGEVLRTFALQSSPGIQIVEWDLRVERRADEEAEGEESRARLGGRVGPGEYRWKLAAGEIELTQTSTVAALP